MRSKLFLLLLVAFSLSAVSTAAAQSYAITNARIVTVSGPVIEKGTVIVRNGLIESVGPNLKPPADARVFDATGLTVYPGFIDALTNLALPQPTAPTGAGGRGGAGNPQANASPTPTSNSNYPAGLRPEELTADDLKAGDAQFDADRGAGFTTALSVARTGIFNGRSAVIDLAGDSVSEMLIRSPFAEHISYTTIGGGVYPSSLLGTFSALRQMMYDARHLEELQRLYAANTKGMKRPDADVSLEALIPIVDGRMPVVFNANTEREIVRSLDLIDEFKLHGIIAGGQEAWKVADRLKRENVPVLLSLNFPRRTAANNAEADPETLETLRFRAETPKCAARLAAAGVRFAFESGAAANLGDFFSNAGRSVDNGLSRDAAIRAMTLGSAEILGIGDRTGSIEPGKMANLTLVRGDIFAGDRFVPQVVVDGKVFDIKEQPRPVGGRGQGRQGGGAAATPPPSAGPSLSGAFAIMIDVPGSPLNATLNFSHQGALLTGTMISELGTTELRDGKVTGNEFWFSASVNYNGTNLDITAHGTITGNSVSGTFDSAAGTVPFTGTRNPS